MGCAVNTTGPVFEDEYVNYLKVTYGAGAAPIFFSLDNEPNYYMKAPFDFGALEEPLVRGCRDAIRLFAKKASRGIYRLSVGDRRAIRDTRPLRKRTSSVSRCSAEAEPETEAEAEAGTAAGFCRRGCGFFSAGCGLFSARCGLFSAGCGLFSARCGLFSARCGFFSARCGCFSAGRGLFSAGRGLFSARRGLFSAPCGFFSARYGFFSARCGLFSAACGLFSARRGLRYTRSDGSAAVGDALLERGEVDALGAVLAGFALGEPELG